MDDRMPVERLNYYYPRDLEELGNYYAIHINAMTAEGLHDKTDIAAELAWRDQQLERAREAEKRLEKTISTYRGLLKDWDDDCAKLQAENATLKEQAEQSAERFRELGVKHGEEMTKLKAEIERIKQ